MKEGFKRIPLKYRERQIMTYSIGKGSEVLLMLSGGPGCPCNFLRDTHLEYAKKDFRVVTWDPLGCGESDHVDDDSLWEIERFVEEVEFVRDKLNLGKIHLLGTSWGGLLGLEYLFRYQNNVKDFIIISSTFNVPLVQRGFERYKLALGHETMKMMALREADGTTDHPEYQGAFNILAYRHICRLDEWPECLNKSLEISKPMLHKVFGKYLFNCTGIVRNYDRTNDLHKIKIPCLIIHGEHDYIITECATSMRDYLPNAELNILKNCSHTPFLEDPIKYHNILLKFLNSQKQILNKLSYMKSKL